MQERTAPSALGRPSDSKRPSVRLTNPQIYNVVWNFGDRSQPIFDTFTAPTSEPGTRVTASVTHVFDDYRDSPYFVDVKISGTSESSPLFGQDTIKMTVVGTEQMSVDAGGDQTAAVSRPVRLRAFFEPPESIDQFTYTWDFGDGSNLVDRQPRHPYQGLRPYGHGSHEPRLLKRRGVSLHSPRSG